MKEYPVKIVLSFPATPPAPLPPAHPYYEPTNAFIERHALRINEAEVWVYMSREDGARIDYNKDTGGIVLRDPYGDVPFSGFLPDEQALENIIAYTKW